MKWRLDRCRVYFLVKADSSIDFSNGTFWSNARLTDWIGTDISGMSSLLSTPSDPSQGVGVWTTRHTTLFASESETNAEVMRVRFIKLILR